MAGGGEFGSVEEELQFWRSKANEFEAEAKRAKDELEEFQESSRLEGQRLFSF